VSAFTAPPLRFSLKPLCLAAKSGEVLATEEQGKNKGWAYQGMNANRSRQQEQQKKKVRP
jgi:hypothetical protein